MQNDVNYEMLGRFTFLQQQCAANRNKLRSMQPSIGTLSYDLSNQGTTINCQSIIEKSEVLAAIIPDILKIAREILAMESEMKVLKATYNLGVSVVL